MTKVERKLMPCPFCGEKALMIGVPEDTMAKITGKENAQKLWMVGCPNPKCQCTINKCYPFFTSTDAASRSWNRRTL